MATDFSWGILGTSSGAAQITTALKRGGCHIAGVAGKSFSQAIAFATQNAIMQAMLNPQQLLANQQIDAVFFDTDYAASGLIKRALQSGKHVLLQEFSAQKLAELTPLKKLAEQTKLQLAILNPLLTMPLVKKMGTLLTTQTVKKVTMYIAPKQDPDKYARIFCSWLGSLLPKAKLAVKGKQLLFKGPHLVAEVAQSTEPDLIEKLLLETNQAVYSLDSALVPLSLQTNGSEPELLGQAKLAQLYFVEEFEKQAGRNYLLLEKQIMILNLLQRLM